MPIYLASYGIWRFFIEFLRDDYRGSFLGSLTPSQTQSIFLVLLAIPAVFLIRYFTNKMNEYESAQALLEQPENVEHIEIE